jgi:single-strand DNA-binding protein
VNETYVTIKGRLVADPTVRTTRAGAPMTSFRIASSVRRPVSGQPGVWEDAETNYYDVVTYRALAANVGVSVRKGHPVAVHGRQHIISRPRDDGGTWWAVEVVADAVGHDLSYGTAAFARVSRGQSEADRPAGASGEAREGIAESGFGDPERDPYLVEGGPGGAGGGSRPGGGTGDPEQADAGPLVPVADGDAA